MYCNHKILFNLFLFTSLLTQAQYKYSSNTAHISIVQSIKLNNDIIKERSANFEKKAAAKPLMFVNVKKKISALNYASNDLSAFIKEIQEEVNVDNILYELREEGFYENILFTDDKLSERGRELKVKIDALYQMTKVINIHRLTNLSDFAKEHFDTSEIYYDAYENKVNYFRHVFYDKTNYGIMMNMNYLLLEVKVFQLLYYRTVMSY